MDNTFGSCYFSTHWGIDSSHTLSVVFVLNYRKEGEPKLHTPKEHICIKLKLPLFGNYSFDHISIQVKKSMKKIFCGFCYFFLFWKCAFQLIFLNFLLVINLFHCMGALWITACFNTLVWRTKLCSHPVYLCLL